MLIAATFDKLRESPSTQAQTVIEELEEILEGDAVNFVGAVWHKALVLSS